jgi:hypothetical protein
MYSFPCDFIKIQYAWTHLKTTKIIHGNGMNYIIVNEKQKRFILFSNYFLMQLAHEYEDIVL